MSAITDVSAAFCSKTSPGRERRQQGRECFQPWKLSSEEAYHLHTNTDIALVINLLNSYCVAPTTNGFFFSLFPLTSYWVFFFSAEIARAHSYAWATWQFYLPGRLVNTVNSGAGPVLCRSDWVTEGTDVSKPFRAGLKLNLNPSCSTAAILLSPPLLPPHCCV